MAAYRLTEPARADLLELADHIANDSVDAAVRAVDLLEAALQALAEMPGKGHVRDDLIDDPGLLFWAVGSYLVVYRAGSDPLEVVRILHGRRDVARELSDDLGDRRQV